MSEELVPPTPRRSRSIMAEENFTLTTFYTAWQTYQGQIKASLAPLSDAQLALRAAPDLRSVGENAAHIIGCRAGWLANFLGEDGGADMKEIADWDVSGATTRTAAELVHGLDRTWQFLSDCLARWSADDMRQTFPD